MFLDVQGTELDCRIWLFHSSERGGDDTIGNL